MEAWLGWFAAVLNQNRNFVQPCGLSETGGELLLTKHSAELKTGQDNLVVGDGDSLGYISIFTGEVSAHVSPFRYGIPVYTKVLQEVSCRGRHL